MSKITRLEVSNFKRIVAVAIEPSGAVVQVRGKNGAGKSSCLDAIAAALGGEKLAPAEPVRRGAEGAVVRVELDDGLVVERRWTAAGGSSLKLGTKDGARYDKPQKRLDDLIGRLSFDPLAFLRLPAKEQAETLRRLAGVDFSLLDGKRRTAYEARAAANRDVTQAKARLAALPEVDAPDELASASDLLEEQQRRSAVVTAHNLMRAELPILRQRNERAKEELARAEADIRDLELRLARAHEVAAAAAREVEDIQREGRALRADVDGLVDPDLEEIPRQLQQIEAVNARVRAKQARAAAVTEVGRAEAEAAKHEAEIAAIDEQKAAALAEANLPVEGLGFTESGVTFDDLPLEQASQAQQLRVSVAIGSALNPKLRAMLVRDGSLLDEDSLALLKNEAERADLQVWLEVVSHGQGDGVLIEDGMVVGAEPVEAAHG